MNKKFIITLLIAIGLGFYSASILSDYNNKNKKQKYNAFFIQAGIYSSKDEANKNIDKLDAYIVTKENNKYIVYVGITSNVENKKKIRKIYLDKNVGVLTKKKYVNNDEFITELKQYDILLKELNKEKDIISVNETVLSTYEQVVLKT